MKRTAVINVVGLTKSLIGAHTPHIRDFVARGSIQSIRPAFPAVTCTAQSNYLTGQEPEQHGIVGNGWYDREYAEHRFWKQSNHIVRQPKIWDALKEMDASFTCAKLFWWYNMYASVDYSITPRPMYPADGKKVFDVYTQPMGLRETIKGDLGEFPFPFFWGPMAGIKSSEWIAQSAEWMEAKHSPTLNLVYLPHLDYNLQRVGPNDPAINEDLKAIDTVVGRLIQYFEQRDVQVVLLSEYGITEVSRPVHLNRVFRKQGWIQIKDELGLEQIDCGASQAFAIADHQVAHIYINNPSIKDEVKKTLAATDGVEHVLDKEEKRAQGIDHERAGDLIAVADKDSWFTYYYWEDDAVAPDFARCVDIHRKIGYDPVELFFDPAIRFPKLRVARRLLQKKLGMRMLLDVIPLDASLVKGSHGRRPEDKADWPVFIGPKVATEDEELESADVYARLIECVQGT
ncbi:alkaline phosphatase family protein [Coraliomargarita sinensis]|uniref:Alkaline phosphatase family protein n=1 Tax=Coraliomargarita sinensis TaxID=2174842 RepID=A0A317ZGM0_9BACT|nr:nucleotide pyrophosphatase/phosphodiesterase family protein [Coraliomargarita sinensis]PXA03373.1 alkaline phosphatase family protein [Coraliomargarita sinensis]